MELKTHKIRTNFVKGIPSAAQACSYSLLACSPLLMSQQECLGNQDSVQQSLQQLQALGEQLKSQVNASSSASLQSDHLSLTHRLATLEHSLHRQREVLQVKGHRHTPQYMKKII